MSAMVRFGAKTAILRAGRWLCSDPALEASLNRYTTDYFQSGSAPVSSVDQELAVARAAAGQFGGRVTARVKPKNRAGERYFFAQRQLGFDFPD